MTRYEPEMQVEILQLKHELASAKEDLKRKTVDLDSTTSAQSELLVSYQMMQQQLTVCNFFPSLFL
jgi:hypothetical protein